MKTKIIACLIVSIIIGSPLSFHPPRFTEFTKATITGKIFPPNGADEVWIIGSGDTIKTIVESGNFSQAVKPDTYKLIVNAKQPFKDAMLNNLAVAQNQVLDIGEIILQK